MPMRIARAAGLPSLRGLGIRRPAATRLTALGNLRRSVVDRNWDVDGVWSLYRDRFDKRDRDDGCVPLGFVGGQAPVFPDDEGIESVVTPPSGNGGLLQFEVAAGAAPTVSGEDFLRLQGCVAGVAPRMGCWHCWLHEQEDPDMSDSRNRPPTRAPRTRRHQRARLLGKPCKGHDVRIRHH